MGGRGDRGEEEGEDGAGEEVGAAAGGLVWWEDGGEWKGGEGGKKQTH